MFRLFKTNPQEHWEKAYRKYKPQELGWYQEKPAMSLYLIQKFLQKKDTAIIDVGGGASRLVDFLYQDGYQDLSVLDLSETALKRAKNLFSGSVEKVKWVQGDVKEFTAEKSFGLWHDRAVFHFLTRPEDRKAYVASIDRNLEVGAHVIISTFALDGPKKCSGLNVVRYDAKALSQELGDGYELIDELKEVHKAPNHTLQSFIYCSFKKI